MVRLARPTNMGGGALEVTLFLLVLAPETIKGTKTALETARTFATLLCQPSLRRHLHDAVSVDEFRQQIKKAKLLYSREFVKALNGGQICQVGP